MIGILLKRCLSHFVINDGLDRETKISKETNGQTHPNEYTYGNDR